MLANEITWPCDLSKALKDALLKSASPQVLDENHQLTFGQGGMNGLFYVVEGLVVLGREESSNTSPLSLVKAGQWFGSLLIFKELDFPYQLSSLDYTKILFIPSEAVREVSAVYPETFKLLYFMGANQLPETIDMLWMTTGMETSQRVAYLLMKISERFPRVSGSTPMIPLSQAMLAKTLGLSRISLSKVLHVLEEDKVISIQRKNIHILDISALETLALGEADAS